MIPGSVLAASVTFLLVFPPVVAVRVRRGTVPRRRGYVAAAAWLSVCCLLLVGATGSPLAAGDAGVATALELLALCTGFGAFVSFRYYRRARRYAGVR